MDIPILFEDGDVVVIDKPAGVIINRAQSVKGATLQDWMDEKYDNLWKSIDKTVYPVFFQRSGIAHRLDKDTSGIVLAAKNPMSLEKLLEQFQLRTLDKIYFALSHGLLPSPTGSISASVGRLPWNRERFGVLAGGREAVTDYTLLHTYERKGEKYTLVKLSPKTGRTHQIRIHLKYIGHPIVADSFYAGRKTCRDDLTFCPRLFLHAHSLTFFHPTSGERMTITSPLPKDLEEVLTKLHLMS